MKNFIKISLSLLLLLSFLLTVSCNFPQFFTTTVEEEEVTPTFTLNESFVIVYDVDSPYAEDMTPAIEYLSLALSCCGITTTVQDDSVGDSPAEYEIIVGKTNRPSSVKASKSLRLNDLTYVFESENEIVICGGCPESTLRAVTKFCTNILGWNEDDGEKTGAITVEEGTRYKLSSYYDYEDVMLADAAIENFKIAIPSDEYNALAYQIAFELAQYNGFIVPIVNYSELKETDKNVICIGAADKSGNPLMLEGHTGFLLSSDFENGVITGIEASSADYYAKAVQRWLDNITVVAADTVVDLKFFENSTYVFDTDEALPQWFLEKESIIEISDGITYLMQSFKNEKGEPYKAYSLIVDPTKNSFRMGCSLDGYDYTVTENANRQTVQDHMEAAIANGHNVIAAVNADFFDINGDYHPTGLTIKDGQLISRGAARAYLAIDENGKVFIGENGKKDDLTGIVTAVGGRNVLVRDGSLSPNDSVL